MEYICKRSMYVLGDDNYVLNMIYLYVIIVRIKGGIVSEFFNESLEFYKSIMVVLYFY